MLNGRAILYAKSGDSKDVASEKRKVFAYYAYNLQRHQIFGKRDPMHFWQLTPQIRAALDAAALRRLDFDRGFGNLEGPPWN